MNTARILIALVFFCTASLASLSFLRHNETEEKVTVNSWKNSEVLQKMLEKDFGPIKNIAGGVEMLKSLKNSLNKEKYEDMLREQRKKLSQYLGYEITSADEMDEILSFFDTKNEISFADKVKAFFSFTNILLIFAILVSTIAGGFCVMKYIYPIITDLPQVVKTLALYLFASGVTAGAFFCPESSANYCAFFGALCLGGAYMYHLSTCERQPTVPASIFLPPIIVWSALAILFQTQLIGFITVMAFASFIGFGFWIGPLCTAIGFDKEEEIPKAVPPSLMLLIIYVVKALGGFKHIAYFMNPFNAGVFFVGTFVYFTALLILSSKYFREKSLICYNALAFISGLVVCSVGFLVADLSVFRGVGLTFFVIFLMQKYIEIPWGEAWSIGLLGGGILLILICVMAKTYGTYFIFWNY